MIANMIGTLFCKQILQMVANMSEYATKRAATGSSNDILGNTKWTT